MLSLPARRCIIFLPGPAAIWKSHYGQRVIWINLHFFLPRPWGKLPSFASTAVIGILGGSMGSELAPDEEAPESAHYLAGGRRKGLIIPWPDTVWTSLHDGQNPQTKYSHLDSKRERHTLKCLQQSCSCRPFNASCCKGYGSRWERMLAIRQLQIG